MSSHKHAPWRKSVLIPCWVVQLILLLALIGESALALAVVNDEYFYNEFNEYEVRKNVFNVVAAVLLAIGVISIGLTITEIILLARHKLKPKTFVIMNTIKSTVQVAIFITSIVGVAAQRYGRGVGSVSLAIQAILLLSFLGPLVYGSVIYHRDRKSGGALYKGVHANDLPIDTSYPSQYPPTNYAPKTYPNSYEPARSTDGTTARGDLESGVMPMTERGYGQAGVQQNAYGQARGSPESEPLAAKHANVQQGEAYELANRRELR